MAATVRPLVRWRVSAFDPLSFVSFLDYPHDLLAREWLKHISLFAGRLEELIEDHLANFLQVVSDFDVEHEDVVMRMFVLNLEGEARAWYVFFLDPSIDGWDSFEEQFTMRWENTRHFLLMHSFFNY
jgi:hypothetical protein